jgi:hypothetical protein
MSAYNQIIYNNFTSNKGNEIFLNICDCGGEYNTIYHNNFFDRYYFLAVEMGEPENYWDDGYPSGGNYWSDYIGEDNFSGPKQNIAGSDGIGDIPYKIFELEGQGHNYDRYPLMSPLQLYNNIPPAAPIIEGPVNGRPFKKHEYTISSIDFDSDGLFYFIDWGDGETTGWLGPFVNDWETTVSHRWSKSGEYTIKAKAKDTYAAESDWGTLTVTMPRSGVIHNTYFLHLLENFPLLKEVLLWLISS